MEAEQAESCAGMEQSRADEIRAKQRKSEEQRKSEQSSSAMAGDPFLWNSNHRLSYFCHPHLE